MRICFVGPSNSAHIIKWCIWFSKRGHEVHVISFTNDKIESAIVHSIDIRVNPNGSDVSKLKYLLTGKQIKTIVNEIKPDIINAHYATSYGIAMALSGVKRYILSVWGSDIYDFPNRSKLHKELLKYSLKKATILFSTSQAMADEASKYTNKKFHITPFGVDMRLFNPDKRNRTSNSPFIVGTVKTLSDLYGIKYIIKALAIIKNEHPEVDIIARIAGDGVNSEDYKVLAKKLGVADKVCFLGRIPQEQAANEWANMDVAVIPSISYESFGVAAVEAQACGTPVIVSAVGGLMETTIADKSSFVVPVKDALAIATNILSLYNDKDLKETMGKAGRANVEMKYELNNCFEHIEKIYDRIIRKKLAN